MYVESAAQKEIVYTFEAVVLDSLQNGIDSYSKLLKKQQGNLKLYALLVESGNQFEIYLQEYSHMPKSGFLELIGASNRKLQTKHHLKIPILIPADKMSLQAKKDKIADVPLSGFYIKVAVEDYRQKVVQTSNLF